MDQFYAILTGEEDAFYKMCMALPEVINSVVNEEGGVEVPHDTVIDELRKVASLYGDEMVNYLWQWLYICLDSIRIWDLVKNLWRIRRR